MHTKLVTHYEPSSLSSPTADRDQSNKLRKQREVMNQVLANSLVHQLFQSGCSEGEVIDFASQILHTVTDRGFRNGEERSREPTTEEPLEIRWRLEHLEDDRHQIHGERVCLVPLEGSHRALLAQWQKEPHIQRTCSYQLLDELIQEQASPSRSRVDFIIHNEGKHPIGLVSLFHLDPSIRQAEIAKLLGDPEAIGSGYAHEASGLLLSYAFQVLNLQRVFLRTNGFNMLNIKLNEKLGFQFEGILRASELLNGELIDVVLMSMLAREYYRKYGVRELPDSTAG
jgi:RimJ/RimL family protein N-acetyltransferase